MKIIENLSKIIRIQKIKSYNKLKNTSNSKIKNIQYTEEEIKKNFIKKLNVIKFILNIRK